MKTLRTISVGFLALLVLVSSTSFMVGMHFCQGEIANIALFTSAEGCEREQNLPPCHRHMQAPCCDDETVLHQGDDFSAAAAHLIIAMPIVADMDQPLVLIADIIPSSAITSVQDIDYDPPLRSPDLTVEHHVFLI